MIQMADPGRSMLGWNSGGSWLHGSCAQAAASKDDGKVVDPDESEEKLTFRFCDIKTLKMFKLVLIEWGYCDLIWQSWSHAQRIFLEQFFSELVGLKLKGLRSNYTESWKLWGVQVPQHIWMKLLRDKVLLCAAKATEDEKDGTAMNPEVQRIQPPSLFKRIPQG